MRTMQRILALAGLALATLCSSLAQAAPQNGWWWNPAESGRGFFIEIVGKTVFMAGYFYENDGRAKWLVSTGETSTPTSYDGRLLSVAGGQTLLGDYHAPAAPVDAGAVSVQFIDDTHATLTWPGGTIAIERQVFGTGPAPVQPHIGWWWNDTESGRGYSVEVQGNFLFLVGFMYDAAGDPVWYFTAGPMASDTHFDGDIVQLANGQTLTGAYHPPGTPLKIGTLVLDFTAPDEATLVVSDLGLLAAQGEPAAKAVRSRIITIRPQLPPVPPINLPAKWDGELKQVRTFKVVDVGSVLDTVSLTASASFVEDPFLVPLGRPGKIYSMLGSVRINHVHMQRSAAGGCDSTMTPTSINVSPVDGTLTVYADGAYTLRVRKINMPYVINLDCYVTGPPVFHFRNDVDHIGDLVVEGTGRVVYNQIQGSPPVVTIAKDTTITTTWKLTGAD